MQIKIAERLHPFSHVPGTTCMLPGSALCLQIFPTLLRLYDLASCRPSLIGEASMNLTGPVADFTVIQDLERSEIRVFGQAQEGYFRYHALAQEGSLHLRVVKGNRAIESRSDRIKIGAVSAPQISIERLSLGCHKAQDWSSMQRRLSLEELFPLWHLLGQLTPGQSALPHQGTALLLDACRETIARRDREALAPAFLKLFLAGFSGLFVPRLEDEQHQGFSLPPISVDCQLSPLILLTEGAQLIRSLFFQQEQDSLHILPALPPQFHCGRLLGISCLPFGQLDLEWSKKQIRRLIFRAEEDGDVRFSFQRELKEFRLADGSKKTFIPCGTTVSIQKGKEYLLDNFRQ